MSRRMKRVRTKARMKTEADMSSSWGCDLLLTKFILSQKIKNVFLSVFFKLQAIKSEICD